MIRIIIFIFRKEEAILNFTFDNEKQTIMNIKIKDQHIYRAVRDAMLFNVYEGWKPTTQDVYDTINTCYHPTDIQKQRFLQIFGKEITND